MIRIEAVDKAWPREDAEPSLALRGLSLEVQRGETLCLIGPSGCGKTTTLRLINRLVEPTSGRVLVDGADVASADPVRLRRGMGYVLQRGGLFPHMTVAQNVDLLLRLEGRDEHAARARVRELLERVHLDPETYARRFPAELSGGQRQRVGLARALSLDPPILLLDEPFGALDPLTRDALQRDFLELAELARKTIVLVTHDLREAFLLGDRVALLVEGHLEQVGTEEELRASPASDLVRRFVARHADGD